MRTAKITRKTNETDISLKLNIDGEGKSSISSGCGFLDHMLTLFARHGGFDLEISCTGDSYVDFHHTTEDIAICLGQAFKTAMADKKGIMRYADTVIPMDETLVLAAVDISGRGGFYSSLDIPSEKVGDFDTELCEEFFAAFAREASLTLHIVGIRGKNSHHIIEAAFKSSARSLRFALETDEKNKDKIPSTKGTL